MNPSTKSDILKVAASGVGGPAGHGRNFQPLIAAGSWTIHGFHHGIARCACCNRPIRYVLELKNESHDVSSAFPEVIEIGMTCGPKVFVGSCVGFYTDPSREWERQHRAWKDYISYVILCVKHEKLWQLVPVDLRLLVDEFLQVGYKAQDHSGGWWMVRDAKKRFLKCQRGGLVPNPKVLFLASRPLLYSAKRQQVIPAHWELNCDRVDGTFTLSKEVPVHPTA